MARLYANENFPFQVVKTLRNLGHDVLTSLDAGNANRSIPDDEVLAFSTQEKRALLTINQRDFLSSCIKKAFLMQELSSVPKMQTSPSRPVRFTID